MSHSRIKRQQNQVLNLMVIEDDPVFRLGLLACLEPFDDLQVVLEADSTVRALQHLREWTAATTVKTGETIADQTASGLSARSLALIILNLDLGQTTSSHGAGLRLCRQLRTRYPQYPLLLIGSTLELTRLATAFQAGAGGYCLKGTGVTELVAAIRQVAAGQPYWTEGIQAIATNHADAQFDEQRQLARRSTTHTSISHRPSTRSWLAQRRQNLRVSGVRQIERAIAELNTQLQTDRPLLDQWLLAGQRRELRTARWLVNRLLTNTDEPVQPLQERLPDAGRALDSDRLSQPNPKRIAEQPFKETPITLTSTSTSSLQSPQAALFQATLTKLHGNLENRTETALEIDILKETKKRELLTTVLQKLQAILDDLRLSRLPLQQVASKRSVILQDLWQITITDFFGKYYTLQTETQPIEVVNILLQDGDIVQAEMLDRIPFLSEFLSHLLFQIPLTIDGIDYAAGTVEATLRMELVLQHVTIQVANAVMQPLINRFGDVVAIKQMFYDQRLLSSREIERFRNDLSWKYRTDRIFAEPTAIFESQYQLLTLTGNGISKTTIYAPRNDELAKLSGLPFLVTLVLETRDAIAPRIRAAVSFLGRGVVYVLTEVVGRGIGLIGRGVVKGIGNALQDTKPKQSERWR
ncbi:MAG: DUF3685 domain-containing protein [Stenomitos rutilans HA7619-LM2]|jgi:DNA-binding NarL/FixJ family response regulator|nr:DUF3685 domain-containing protein [Stenomitos rutilans HA7619-LM2]